MSVGDGISPSLRWKARLNATASSRISSVGIWLCEKDSGFVQTHVRWLLTSRLPSLSGPLPFSGFCTCARQGDRGFEWEGKIRTKAGCIDGSVAAREKGIEKLIT